jgi:hypothetical protein
MREINAELIRIDGFKFQIKGYGKYISIKDQVLQQQWESWKLNKIISFEYSQNGEWRTLTKFLSQDELNKELECNSTIYSIRGILESKNIFGFKLKGNPNFFSIGDYRRKYLLPLAVDSMVEVSFKANRRKDRIYYNTVNIKTAI